MIKELALESSWGSFMPSEPGYQELKLGRGHESDVRIADAGVLRNVSYRRQVLAFLRVSMFKLQEDSATVCAQCDPRHLSGLHFSHACYNSVQSAAQSLRPA